MEALFVYLLKSSGLIIVFYLAYHFLVRKETFFSSNRWFLLSGLVTSALLPLFVIRKIIWIERPKIVPQELIAYTQQPNLKIQDVPVDAAFDWMQFLWVSYIIIAIVLVIRIVFNFTSLYRMLYQQQVIKKEQFKLVNLNENIAPFSFFNYIVYNSNLYSNEELQSILLHEKIHSQQKHSLDILIAKLFCIVFWFNPFAWLYKKAITQNLEYIADQKAIEQLEDKKSYQRALLKVVSHQSCLSITNNFYQSLIKKRIVMLNKNQSDKRNSWKYALIIPALIGFVFLFQIKTIAQEKEETNFTKRVHQGNEVRVVVDKNSTDNELKSNAEMLKKEHGITLKCSKVKRNSAGEITGIKVEFKDKDGNKGVSQVDGKEPIKPIHFYKNDASVGFGSPRNVRVYANVSRGRNGDETPMAIVMNDSTNLAGNFDFDFDTDVEAPEPPEAPETPEAPEAMVWGDNQNIVIKTDGDKKPMVVINGKVLTDDKEIEEAMQKYSGGKAQAYSFSSSSDGDKRQIIINGKDMMKIKSDAMANAHIQMKRMRPMMAQQMELVKAERGKAKAEMERNRAEMDRNKPEVESARAEMLQAKAEMEKAKAEMASAKAEYEKAKAEMKNKK